MSSVRRLLPALLAALALLAGCDNGGTYHRKAGRWHFEDKPMLVADPASFKPLGRYFARDKQRGYYLGEAVPRDTRSAFREGRAFKVRDLASFELLDAQYARDAQRAYYDRAELAHSHGARFELLGRGYARDGARVWWQGQPVAGADAAGFAVLDEPTQGHDAQDARSTYLQGARQGQREGVAASSSPTVRR